MYLLFLASFDHIRLHVVSLRGRPALLAHEVGAAAGYLDAGATFVSQIRREWSELLHDDDDVAEVTGAELASLKREIPALGPTAAVIVLFPTGVEKALTRSTARFARPLLGYLHAEVFSRVATLHSSPPDEPRASAPAAADAPAAPVVEKKDFVERYTAYQAVRRYAALVLRYEEDVEEYLNLELQAVELMLGGELVLLTPPPAPVAPRRAANAAA